MPTTYAHYRLGEEVREKLLELPGVGPKVADCIMLFSLKKFDVFPIDVWVRRVMNDLYIKEKDEEKVNKKQVDVIIANLLLITLCAVII